MSDISVSARMSDVRDSINIKKRHIRTSDRFTKYKVDGWVICFFGTLVAIAFRDVRFDSRTDWTL
jgi:hypothetical protein